MPLKVQRLFLERLGLFIENPHAPELKNHALRGEFKGKRSISINGDIRALYKNNSDGSITILTVGTHHELYGT
jgi:addiction module RelE/StbE family toxin